MAQVSAPYNFVPLNEKVFFPPWADLVSHDVPFKNGLSGQIELEITAESPIFIRKPYEEGDAENSYYTNANDERISKEFCHIKDEQGNKRYYIPGSSIRNMLRSVVEIMGFGKMKFISNTLSEKKAYRDMANRTLYDIAGSRDIRMGWLINEYNIITIKDAGRLGNLRDRNNANTVYRPNNYNSRGLNYFEDISFNDYKLLINPDTSLSKKYEIYNKYYYSASDFDPKDESTIILTGNINGKRNEFIFITPNKCNDAYSVSKNVWKEFVSVNNNSDNWSFWEPLYNNGNPVPVFYRLDDDNGTIKDFGLVVLYKKTYKNSVLELIRDQQPEMEDSRLDFVETLFGDVDNVKLKGRVQVSHAFANSAIPAKNEYTLILGEPKETYYPFYIEQAGFNNQYQVNSYKTFNDGNISGRKRYPVHHIFNPSDIEPEREHNQQGDQSNVSTTFKPLISDSKFTAIINYHNLLPEELGALLSAITFHNNSDLRHNIGLAKAYGFGKINISINNIKTDEINKYLCSFEKRLNTFTTSNGLGKWIETDQIKELFAMALRYQSQDRRKLKYMKLSDFYRLKRDSKALPDYSKFMNIPNNLLQFNSKIYSQVNCIDSYQEIIENIKNKLSNIESKLQQ